MRLCIGVVCTFACTFAVSTLHADFAFDGFFQSWLRLGPLTHGTGSCNFPPDVQNLDYIVGEDADTGEEVSEQTVLPVDFDAIQIDFGQAASLDVLNTLGGQNPEALNGIAEWILYDSPGNTIVDSVFYGEDTHHHVTYNVMYLTNLTEDPMFLVGGIGSDDALTVLMDNTYFGVIDACRPPGGDTEVQNRFGFALPPGEHRVLVKLFDWEGDSAFRFRLEWPDGTPLLGGGDVSASVVPTELESLPPPPTATVVRSVPDSVEAGVPFEVTLTVTGGPVTIYEQVPADVTITDPGAGTQNGQQIVWENIEDAAVTYTVQVDATSSDFTGVAEEAGGVWVAIGGATRVTPADVVEGGWSTADIADSGLEGSALVQQVEDDPPTFNMEITGSGHDIWDNADDFRFVWKVVDASSTVVIQGRLNQFDRVTNDWGKAGFMMRKDTTQGSPQVFNMFRPGAAGSATHGSTLQWRDTPDGASAWGGTLTEYQLPMWLRARYFGGLVSGFVAPDPGTGDPPAETDWIPTDAPDHILDLDGAESFLVGVAVSSHDDGAQATAILSQVTLSAEIQTESAIRETTAASCAGEVEVTLTLSVEDPGGADVTIVETLPVGAVGVDPGPGEFVAGEFRFSGTANDGDTITYTLSGVTAGAAVSGTINGFLIAGDTTIAGTTDVCPDELNEDGELYINCGNIEVVDSFGRVWQEDSVALPNKHMTGPNANSATFTVCGGFGGSLDVVTDPWIADNFDPVDPSLAQIFTVERWNDGPIEYTFTALPETAYEVVLIFMEGCCSENCFSDGTPACDGVVNPPDGSPPLVDPMDPLASTDPCRVFDIFINDELRADQFSQILLASCLAGTPVGDASECIVVSQTFEVATPDGRIHILLEDLGAGGVPQNASIKGISIRPAAECVPEPEICDNGRDDDCDGLVDGEDVDDCGGGGFVRGDSNADGTRNITDGVFIFSFLFTGGDEPPCRDSADTSDQGSINITSGIYILNHLFLGGPPPPAPFPECGADPTDDNLTCDDFTPCL